MAVKKELSQAQNELANQAQGELTNRVQSASRDRESGQGNLFGNQPPTQGVSWLECETAQWVRAMRWQRTVTGAVARVGLRFTEWLVLVTTLELIRANQDAVCQSDVCRALGLTRVRVSVAMCALAEKGLVDRGPDVDGWMWRVFVTKQGETRIAEARAGIVAAANYPPPRSPGSAGSPRIAKRR